MSVKSPYLVVDNVSYEVANKLKLNDTIILEAEAGDIIAIVGPNGAGKSTLIRMIAGLMSPTQGAITLGGLNINAMRFSDRARQIAYVGQSDQADFRLSVSQYVSLGLLPHGKTLTACADAIEAIEAIQIVGLEKLALTRLDQLSGGELQKARIARAICQKPKLLVLDEPTNHLDPLARGDLLSLIAQLGITIIAALHDLTLIEAFAHKTAVMHEGKLLAFGASSDVLSSAQIRSVFGVELHRLAHPHEDRFLPTLDIQISAATPSQNQPV